jgi:hypothetical protein
MLFLWGKDVEQKTGCATIHNNPTNFSDPSGHICPQFIPTPIRMAKIAAAPLGTIQRARMRCFKCASRRELMIFFDLLQSRYSLYYAIAIAGSVVDRGCFPQHKTLALRLRGVDHRDADRDGAADVFLSRARQPLERWLRANAWRRTGLRCIHQRISFRQTAPQQSLQWS